MSNRGMLIVYSGPSGVGKGTLLAPYLKSHPDAALSVSVTTRAPRPGETDGVEYSFITRERFEQLIKSDGLLEYAEYSGNYYGTPRAAVEEKIAAGRDVVLEIEVQGAMKIKKSFPDAAFIFILPPPMRNSSGGCRAAGPNRRRWSRAGSRRPAGNFHTRGNTNTRLSTTVWKPRVRSLRL